MFQKPQHIIHMLYHNIYGRTPSLAVEEQNTFYLTKSVLILFNNVDCWYKTQCMRPLAILQYTENVARNFRHSLRILTPWRSSWSTNRGRWQWWASSGWPPPSKRRKTNNKIWDCLSSPPTLHTWELVSPCALHAFFAQPPSHQHTRSAMNIRLNFTSCNSSRYLSSCSFTLIASAFSSLSLLFAWEYQFRARP